MHSIWRLWAVTLLIVSLAGSLPLVLHAQQPQSVTSGVYTDAQAMRGQTIYNARCSTCHGPALAGRTGPPLTGSDFLGAWGNQPLLELANKIQRTMPKDDTAKLTGQNTADVVAYLLQAAKFPSGQTELQSDEAALKRISLPAGATSAPKSATASQTTLPPVGNVAQVMRGMLFPTANIIFTVQSIDPGAKTPAKAAGDPLDSGGFNWFEWGGTIYKGWDMVDYAAVSLGESATLMLTPGRRCENGKPVPLNDPEWLKFTAELAEAGKAAYKASQTRDQATVSEVTNQVNDACSHCHGVYRGRTHCAK